MCFAPAVVMSWRRVHLPILTHIKSSVFTAITDLNILRPTSGWEL